MELFLIGIIVFVTIGLVICFVGMYLCDKTIERSKEVYKFKCMLEDMAYDYNKRHIKEIEVEEIEKVYNWFVDKWSYKKLLDSSKPLTLEEWYTKEEIERINT